MKLTELIKHRLLPKTIADIEINPADIISNDEFNSPTTGCDYRVSAINRLIDLKFNFTSNTNLCWDMIKKWVRVRCPACNKELLGNDGGFCGRITSMHFVCKECSLDVSLCVPNNGLSVEFKPLL